MPTGYTAAIKDGIDFKTFAMDCARAFGACVMLRDEGGGGEKIPESFQPSDYSARRLKETEERLAVVQAMTDAQCEAEALSAWEKSQAYRANAVRERKELRRKYSAMLEQVEAWQPPTNEHVELKKFMRDQIVRSIEFDCSLEYLAPEPKLSGAAWCEQEISRLTRDVAYHTKENEKEIERTRQRNEWITALRASLDGLPA